MEASERGEVVEYPILAAVIPQPIQVTDPSVTGTNARKLTQLSVLL